MGKSIVDNQEFFDGRPVEKYRGKFSAPFDLNEEAGLGIDSGSQVTFIVTARCQTPRFKDAPKSGELIRENTFKVEAVVPIASDEAKFLLDNMGELVEGVNDGLIESQMTTPLPSSMPSVDLCEPQGFFETTPLVTPVNVGEGTLGSLEEEAVSVSHSAAWSPFDQPMFDTELNPTFEVVEI